MADLEPFGQFQRKGFEATERDIRRLNRVLVDEYRKALRDIQRELESIYARVLAGVAPIDRYNEVVKFGRLQKLMRTVQDLFVAASIKAGRTTERAARVALANNFYRQQFALKFASDYINPFSLSFAVLNPTVVEVSVFGTPQVWAEITKRAEERISATYGNLKLYQPQHGTLTETLLRNRQDSLLRIRQAITQGLIQGRSYPQVARELRSIMNNTTYKAMRIVRTESNRNMNAGHFAASNVAKDQGVDLRRMIVSTLDDRVRAQSASMDGNFENEEGLFVYPNGVKAPYPGQTGVPGYDINDRESVIDVLPDYPPNERRGRDPSCEGPRSECTQVFSYRNFDTWARQNGLRQNRYGEWVLKS